MPFGLSAAPAWCQYAMDCIIGGAGVAAAKAFFDDITVWG